MVDPIIDFNRVEALPYKKTVAMVNNFIINTTQFLNRFAYLCEKKLTDVDRNIQRLEITMNILEQKLASIQGLEGIQGAPATQQPPQAQPQTTAAPTTTATTTTAPPPPSNIPTPPPPPGVATPAPVVAAPSGGGVTNQNDPRYARFFKMLKIGVPAAQIRQKMMFEGVDPDILDNPDGTSDYKPDNDEDDDMDDDEPKASSSQTTAARADRDDDEDEDEDEEDDFDDD
eukprot:TRINITY_DN5981_c0_g1_i1.p1 TRINITY_DN5981_c0_g1~~TRINITY_DN5981_c0_g1_i1.p1  ORF type:complete len:229 (+),score=83.27 TRINITY_DN5981_c0_g1_i1:368-1054(+)